MIKPIDDRILVSPVINKEEKTKGGIYLPESLQEKKDTLLEGVIEAVGDGVEGHVKMKVKVGDKILFGKYAGTEAEDRDGKKYLMMRQADVYATIE